MREIYEALAFDDIRHAADLLRPVYDQTSAGDGYVSLEVAPSLAHDTAATISEAKRLFAALDRPNVMIKVPATPAGMPDEMPMDGVDQLGPEAVPSHSEIMNSPSITLKDDAPPELLQRASASDFDWGALGLDAGKPHKSQAVQPAAHWEGQ